MNGSECLGWRFEFGICSQSIYLGFGQKLVDLGSFKFWVMLEFYPCENFRDLECVGVKQCHKIVS